MEIGHSLFERIISLENLLLAWQEFRKGKRGKPDVQEFERHLEDNLFKLHRELTNEIYRHGPYQRFTIRDPKYRIIHKATVWDRIVHHAVFRVLYPLFDNIFLFDSYSCRIDKGTHGAVERLNNFILAVSDKFHGPCFALKCDIAKFFANVDHQVLLNILGSYIPDQNLIWLLKRVINSFSVHPPLTPPIKGGETETEFPPHQRLGLELHPNKIFIKTVASGLDFLGWVHFHDHWVLRATTRRRMMKRILSKPKEQSLQSYFGLLKHGNTYQSRQELVNYYWFVTQL